MIIPIVRYLSAGILSYSIGIDVLAGHKLNKMKKLDVNIASGNQLDIVNILILFQEVVL